jgi:hypothetical protein
MSRARLALLVCGVLLVVSAPTAAAKTDVLRLARRALHIAERADKAARAKPKPIRFEGHAYADITAGPRNGMYVNTSGNERDGQAFVLVERDGKEHHIYGTGKDRLVVCLKPKNDDAGEAKGTAPAGTTGSA